MEKEIKFKNLSIGLKILIVYGWIAFSFSVILFILGFIQGLLL